VSGRAPAAPRLVCRRCGAEFPLAPRFLGCDACRAGGSAAALEVAYDWAGLRAAGTLAAWAGRAGGLWRFQELLPLPAGAVPVTLVEGNTPLVRLETPGPGRIWVKDESRNPTGAFKDRLHAVSVSMARALGFERVTASTTGNHGTSLAAYAARAGLRALVFCDPGAPEVQRRLMQRFGARVVVLADRDAHLERLVRERGWYPSTGLDPLPVGAPFGTEGYKTIAYEIYFQLGHRLPRRVLVPTAGGDAVYGPWKGFRELRALGVGEALPAMVAVQAAGCDPIVAAWRRGAREVGVHPAPRTLALSIGDPTGGPGALAAVYESGGSAEAVPDPAIVAAMRRLARSGIAVEPAAAAAVAAALAQAARGEIGADDDVVCVLTGAGVKWPDTLLEPGEGAELPAGAPPAALEAFLDAASR
jgi:threonine synthase